MYTEETTELANAGPNGLATGFAPMLGLVARRVASRYDN